MKHILAAAVQRLVVANALEALKTIIREAPFRMEGIKSGGRSKKPDAKQAGWTFKTHATADKIKKFFTQKGFNPSGENVFVKKTEFGTVRVELILAYASVPLVNIQVRSV